MANKFSKFWKDSSTNQQESAISCSWVCLHLSSKVIRTWWWFKRELLSCSKARNKHNKNLLQNACLTWCPSLRSLRNWLNKFLSTLNPYQKPTNLVNLISHVGCWRALVIDKQLNTWKDFSHQSMPQKPELRKQQEYFYWQRLSKFSVDSLNSRPTKSLRLSLDTWPMVLKKLEQSLKESFKLSS